METMALKKGKAPPSVSEHPRKPLVRLSFESLPESLTGKTSSHQDLAIEGTLFSSLLERGLEVSRGDEAVFYQKLP